MMSSATIAEILLKSEASVTPTSTLKASEELRYTLGVAYAANRADPLRGADGFRDFAGADALRNAAWGYLRKSAKVGLDHRHGTDGAGTVVESYVWPQGAPDWPQASGYVVKSGDWLLGVVWEPKAWESIKRGKRTGYSIQGGASRRAPTSEALGALRKTTTKGETTTMKASKQLRQIRKQVARQAYPSVSSPRLTGVNLAGPGSSTIGNRVAATAVVAGFLRGMEQRIEKAQSDLDSASNPMARMRARASLNTARASNFLAKLVVNENVRAQRGQSRGAQILGEPIFKDGSTFTIGDDTSVQYR